MCWLIVIAIVIFMLFMFWASADIGSNIYLRALCRSKTSEKIVALTFDDGPHAEMTPRVLDLLKKNDVKATFFLIGRNAEQSPELVRRMVDEGHIVANHTFSHQGVFPLSSAATVADELRRCNDTLYNIIGRRPKLFRPPFGVTNPIIGGVVNDMKFRTIGWSIRSLDTVESRSRTSVCRKVLNSLRPGAVILLHDRCANSPELLEMLISGIRNKGYRVVPITEMFNIDAYES